MQEDETNRLITALESCYNSKMANLIENGKAKFEYEFLENFEAGIELLGLEVKTLRNHRGSLLGAHVIVRGIEAYVINMEIPPYQQNNTAKDYDPKRNRKLLLSKKEIQYLGEKESAKGLTIIPVSIYSKGRKLKVNVAVVRGKKLHDKRESIKKRDVDREMRRELKS